MGTPALKFSISNKPDIISVLEREVVSLTQRGRYFWACCPLHEEKTPSFKVDTGRQSFYCFGCHESGDVITLMMKLHGLSFREALSYLWMKCDRPDPARIAEVKERKELLAAFREWEREMVNILSEALLLFRSKEAAGFTWREALAFADVLQDMPYVEWLYEEVFCKSDEKAKLKIFEREINICNLT